MRALIEFTESTARYVTSNILALLKYSLAAAVLVLPAYVIGSYIFVEAEMDELTVVKEEKFEVTLEKGYQDSKYYGPKAGKSKIIRSLKDLK